MESAELIAILREVRERVRARNPQAAAGVEIALPDLMPLMHARDAAMGRWAANGTVNPRAGGIVNGVVQMWKRLLARVLDWHVREQVEFNRNVVACTDAYARKPWRNPTGRSPRWACSWHSRKKSAMR